MALPAYGPFGWLMLAPLGRCVGCAQRVCTQVTSTRSSTSRSVTSLGAARVPVLVAPFRLTRPLQQHLQGRVVTAAQSDDTRSSRDSLENAFALPSKMGTGMETTSTLPSDEMHTAGGVWNKSNDWILSRWMLLHGSTRYGSSRRLLLRECGVSRVH